MQNKSATSISHRPRTALETPTLEVSVVMPCLNEAETLATCVQKARRALDYAGLKGGIIVADNGSTDGSREIARRSGARLVDVEARGATATH